MAIARVLGEESYRITLAARRADKLSEAAATLAREGIDVQPVVANVSDEQQIAAMVHRHRERFGRLDVLVNNAGLIVGGSIAEHPTKALDLQISVNLRAVQLTTRECLPMLRQAGMEHRNALIVNMASITGKAAWAGLAAYSMTKSGIVGFTQALHQELSHDGIKATALCPGLVETPMTDRFKQWVAGEDMMRPDDIAGAVRYLVATSPACIVPEMQFIRPGKPTSGS